MDKIVKGKFQKSDTLTNPAKVNDWLVCVLPPTANIYCEPQDGYYCWAFCSRKAAFICGKWVAEGVESYGGGSVVILRQQTEYISGE